METYESRLIDIIKNSNRIMTILKACRDARLPEWRLVSGAIYGTVFNKLTSRDPDYGIKDYDIAYYDPDNSYQAEDLWIKKIDAALPENLRPLVEVRNQARVHLWFEQKFGAPYPPLKNTDESLERYLCYAHAVAIRLENDDTISIAAPFGLDDVFNMVMRPNPNRGQTENRLAKSLSIKERWPEVTIIT
ncbi:MAG: nucleotidyltransferase family protein [Caulobacterales bacterium]|nr:nucleotidyltransferase family protein [Caulobacterales bacterium]